MNSSPKHTAALSPEKRGLFSMLLREEGVEVAPRQNIPRRKEFGSVPLSFAQQRFWFLDQLEPGSPLYNIAAVVRLNGRLDMTALKQSLDEIVRRHEILRTTFAAAGGKPVQVVAPNLMVPLPLIDLSELSEGAGEAESRRLAAEEAQRPFDLRRGPLVRAAVLRRGQQEHVLLLTLHHIIFDGWSEDVLFRELTALYEAFSRGDLSPLAELPIQYADYAMWQREWLPGEVLERQLAYWKERLSGAPTMLELPTRRPRPLVQSFRGAGQSLMLPEGLSDALKELSRREGVTLFMTLLAAFQTLLHRYTGQADILVGSPLAGRNRVETEDLIGNFLNTLVFRTDLSLNPTFRELLGRVRDITLGAYAHQDVPFEKLVEELRPERSASHTPLFQVMFVLQNTPRQAPPLPGLTLSQLEGGRVTAKFDLTLEMVEKAGGLCCLFEYNTDLFDDATITRMLGHFRTLLEGIAIAGPEQRLSELPLLPATERHQLLTEWNNNTTTIRYAKSQCLHQLFEAQAERSPDSVAVVFEGEQITYRELNRRANQLAHHLRKLGVGPEVLVGICVERSLEMIVGILGTLKAGGAYVPLDPTYPRERLALMLEDAGAPVVLTQRRLVPALPEGAAQFVCLDSDSGEITRECEENLGGGVRAENLAYVIFTSGSTGRPKGALITHHNVTRLFAATREWFDFDDRDVWTLFHSYAFDFSVWELWGALLHGGRLVVVSHLVSRSPEEFYRLLCDEQVTVLNQTPSAFRQLIDAEETSTVTQGLALRFVIFGGEALELQSLKPWFDRHGDERPRLINMYGITETTVHVTIRRLTAADLSTGARSMIGGPIKDLRVYVLDCHLNPVPVGVVGEIYVGGAGLARGYLNNPELTAERFIPDPFSAEEGARLYQTGDLARHLADGEIEYLGRLDSQVKVRGFRIELGEVEAALGQHPAVRASVVMVREDVAGEKRLVAYLAVGQEESSPPRVGELRDYLKERLPEYMVPSAFVVLRGLPLTPNGKVDRRALPVPDHARPASEATYVAPRNPVEEVVAGIWAEVLGVSEVGAHDNFFDLGGHSLMATQVISRARAALDVELPLSSLFEAPTVAGVAERIEMARRADDGPKAPPIRPASREQALPLSFVQEQLWFFDKLKPGSSAYNVVQAVRMSGALNIEALRQTLRSIVARHEALRTTFASEGGEPVQVIAPAPSTTTLPVSDLNYLPESERELEVQRLVAEEVQHSFDLAEGPLFRASLLRVSNEEHVLLINMHHIISDGWSVGVLFQELATLYEAYSAGEPSPLPELPIQYADYAVWQREWLRGDVLEKQLSYWKQRLKGAPAVLELPADRPRPAAQSLRGARHLVRLPKDLSEKLKALSRREGVTLFMTLLAAFQTLLYRDTGEQDITVGTDVANRNRLETEKLIGFFINNVVMRTDLSGNPTFREVLGRVREVALEAYAHQDLPFNKLVEGLKPERDLSHTPLFQVLFVLQNAPAQALKLPGLTLSPLELNSGTSKFDIALFMEETEPGLTGIWAYKTDLFDHATIERMAGRLANLLESIVAQPDARLNALELLTETERRRQAVEEREEEEDQLKKLRSIKRKTLDLSQVSSTKTGYLWPGETLPLVVEPNMDGIDLVKWATNNRQFIKTELSKHGAILLRGFNPDSASEFEQVASSVCPELFGEYGDLPREGMGGKVYGSTPYPADQAILFHNESSHMHRWPMKIWFFCVKAAERGGETPVVDCRRIYQLLDPQIREQFAQKKLMYVRNYTDGLDVSWQEFFHTGERSVVEEYCRRAGMGYEWKNGNRLRTRQVCQAVAKHPGTGEMVFFNQLQLHHVSCLGRALRESLWSMFGEEDLPRHVYYGDGTPIEDSVVEEIEEVYRQTARSFPWQEGDILMLDNMLVAHGRNPYVGARKIVVAMGEMINKEELSASRMMSEP